MSKRYLEKITKEQLASARIPINHILVEMRHSVEGIKSKGGIIVGFRTDETFEGTESHAGDLTEVYGEVYKVPERLFFDLEDEQGMPWECDMELQVGDTVWFSALESKNSIGVECEGITYLSIPYQDCFVAKRITFQTWGLGVVFEGGIQEVTTVIPLNGYILCSPVYKDAISSLDVTSADAMDTTRGKVAFIGKPVSRYMRDVYTDIPDLQVGDVVQLEAKTPIVWLERKAMIATFDGDNLYFILQRRRISLIIERNDT